MQYLTTTTVKRDGLIYQPGTLIELSDAEVKQLLELKAIEPVDMPFSDQLKTLGG